MVEQVLRDAPVAARARAEAKRMKATSLLYHDVVADPTRHEESGFSGEGAALYKLARVDFEKHAAAVHHALRVPPTAVTRLQNGNADAGVFLLTFDDGGGSAHSFIASVLRRYGWPAHFFVTADFIGTPGFLTPDQIRDLHREGHVIGSHSCSHPARISACSREHLQEEWGRSVHVLSQIIGQPVTTASDIYSLGVILYRLLTGRAPYELKDSTTGQLVEVVCKQEPAPAGIDGDLDAVIARCLRKDPERRYRSVDELNDDLALYLEGRIVGQSCLKGQVLPVQLRILARALQSSRYAKMQGILPATDHILR